MSSPKAHQNQLQFEKSPYLLQHADNPVDWYPWGDEAFTKARNEDKPVFLSIGYSTCHWCHVMAHESFEDEQVAARMNELFVCIKVDREERPDVDNIYMTACQMLSGHGGWPLTIIMTPDKLPFFAATYIPKENRFGRPGMLEIMNQIENLWLNRRADVINSAQQITSSLQELALAQTSTEPERISEGTLRHAYAQLDSRFDERYGGFGKAPKFPSPHNLLFLLRYWKRSHDERALQMVEKTLHEMRMGGVYDHIGFGFHRYSTDSRWLLPHFEKMLYDQAMMTMAYTETFLATGNRAYQQTAREILTYVLRDMTDPAGGFYSAEDADSEGEEGKFYVWTLNEIRKVLDSKTVEMIQEIFNIEPSGNYQEETTREYTGQNILYLTRPLTGWAHAYGMPETELAAKIEAARQKLFDVREKRIHPGKDDKILTDWNGLMIAALAKAGQAFDEPDYIAAAEKSAEFILNTMRDAHGRLWHRYRDGEAGLAAHVDDYAYLIWGLTELYQATFNTRYLETALELTDTLIAQFWDETAGGFYFTAADGEALIVRQKEFYDGAIPSGNSVAAYNLLRLNRLTGRTEFEEKAHTLATAFGATLNKAPSYYTFMLTALDFAFGPAHEIVIVGDPDATDTKQFFQALRHRFLPNAVVLHKPVEGAEAIEQLADFTRTQTHLDGNAAAYVCENFSCNRPTTEVQEMLHFLGIKE